jgi:hypothetical protein
VPEFVPHLIDPRAAHAEIAELRALLQSNVDLKEAVFRDFFRSRPHATALIGPYSSSANRSDLIAYEYPLFGDFRCDLAIADSVTRACTFVELEDAGPAVCSSGTGRRRPGSGALASTTGSPRWSTGSTSSRT